MTVYVAPTSYTTAYCSGCGHQRRDHVDLDGPCAMATWNDQGCSHCTCPEFDFGSTPRGCRDSSLLNWGAHLLLANRERGS